MKPSTFLSNLDRYWAKVDRRDPSGCWPWVGEVNNKGYGRLDFYDKYSRTRVMAHRLALKVAGVDLSDDQVVMHTCDNPPCCNPAHLRVGTQKQNIQDARAKGRLNLAGLDLGLAARMSKRSAA